MLVTTTSAARRGICSISSASPPDTYQLRRRHKEVLDRHVFRNMRKRTRSSEVVGCDLDDIVGTEAQCVGHDGAVRLALRCPKRRRRHRQVNAGLSALSCLLQRRNKLATVASLKMKCLGARVHVVEHDKTGGQRRVAAERYLLWMSVRSRVELKRTTVGVNQRT